MSALTVYPRSHTYLINNASAQGLRGYHSKPKKISITGEDLNDLKYLNVHHVKWI